MRQRTGSRLWLGAGLILAVVLWGVSGIGCSGQSPGTNNDAGATDSPSGSDSTGIVPDTSGGQETTPKPEPSPEPGSGPDHTTPPPDRSTSSTYNWYKHVQPLIQQNCQNCHSQGGIGPFPLTNYEEVKSKAAVVKWAVENRTMPPWSPTEDGDCKKFAHSRRLSQEQVDTIVKWVDSGTPMGDPKDGTTYSPKQDKLDSIDADVDIQTDYTPPGITPDDYHCFLTKPVISGSQGKELTGFQLVPGVKSMVHHVLIYGVSSSYAKTLEGKHPNKHWSCSTGALFTGGSAGNATLLGVWVPGTDVVRFPDGTGLPMRAGDHLVLEIHYNLSALSKPQADRTSTRLQYAKTPVKYRLQLTIQLELGIAIPPKSKDHTEDNTLNVPSNVRVWGIMPHMHKFGSKFKIDMYKGGGANKECFVDIPKWDYNWQQTYFFNNPTGVLLQRGDKAKMTCSFNNPTDKTITWGDRTGDEMCLNFYFISAP